MSEQQPLINWGSLIGTSITGQTLGGAMAVVWLAYHHIEQPANGIDTKTLEEALTVLFSTGVSILAIFGHILVAILMRRFLPSN